MYGAFFPFVSSIAKSVGFYTKKPFPTWKKSGTVDIFLKVLNGYFIDCQMMNLGFFLGAFSSSLRFSS